MLYAPSRFQFTPLREGRQHPRGVYVLGIGISIHAPPRGATSSIVGMKCWSPFQFTPLREGRRNGKDYTLDEDVFQFTPLREGRRLLFRLLPRPFYFNSRPSARGDAHSKVSNQARHLFQFTPLREGRPGVRPARRRLPISIHAPPRGATRKCALSHQQGIISIHAPPRGATADVQGCLRHCVFQFTPLREGRHGSR